MQFRNSLWSWLWLCLLSLPNTLILAQSASSSTERPNIVWIVTEDNSKHFMRLYEEGGAPMPNIEALARQGLVFDHAFSQAPVCSVARSTLITGSYAPRIGAHYHRATERVPMPEGLEMFPFYLRQAGYYTTNNAKEDYNLIKSDQVWDESSRQASYRNRQPGQPFFHVQNFGITHEGQLHFTSEEMKTETTSRDPDSFTPFPYHPNTPTFRYTYARHYDLHLKADQQIGAFIDQLRADGLLDNTIIFYYGDHGGVLPRSKGYVYESGLHVPLVVYFPEKWKALAPAPLGSRVKAFVEFMDFGPTVLHLAGVAVPRQMDGRPFLGADIGPEQLQTRDVTFSYADRFDEKYDLVRAVRKGKFKYHRNYQPFNVDALYNYYRYRMLAYQEWQDLYRQDGLNAAQRQFFEPRAPEALYDLENDPHETRNLAGDPQYRSQLLELRARLQQQLRSMPDLSFIPEPVFLAEGAENPVHYGQEQKERISRLMDIADLSLLPFREVKRNIRRALRAADPLERYWGLTVCSRFGPAARSFYGTARKLMTADPDPLVRTRAAEFLALSGQSIPEQLFIDILDQARSETEVNLILNTAALLQDTRGLEFSIPEPKVRPAWLSMPGALITRRLAHVATGERPRLLVLTDIGGDPDDTQSLIRLLLHADQFEIEGLIASASGTPGELQEAVVRPDLIREVIGEYGKVADRLQLHSPYFPQAHSLLNLVKSGNPDRGWERVGAEHDTEGSNWIIRLVDQPDPRPLNICIWGGQTDLAQALWRVKQDRTEAGYRDFVAKLRIYDIADQDGIFDQIWSHFPGLWYILNRAAEGQDKRNAVFRGMYLGGDESLTSRAWFEANVINEHGPLGAIYPQKTWTAPNPHSFMKEGDTPSWFYFLPNGLNVPSQPEYGGWGGRFQMSKAGYYIDAQDEAGGQSTARSTVWRWRPDFQQLLAGRMDWCVSDYAEANHAPQIVAENAFTTLSAKAGTPLIVDAPGVIDPDGDPIRYQWRFYAEAGSYRGTLPVISSPDGKQVSFTAPADGAGRTLHLILSIADEGEPQMTTYHRYLIQIR